MNIRHILLVASIAAVVTTPSCKLWSAKPSNIKPSPTPVAVSNSNANAGLYQFDEPTPPKSKTIAVSAKKMWVDTGIDLVKGQKFMVIAEGSWSVGRKGTGPLGTPLECRDCIVPEANLGKLVAKIGNDAFVIGDNMQLPSPDSGRLYLSVNDRSGAFRDNRGVMRAYVAYGRRPI